MPSWWGDLDHLDPEERAKVLAELGERWRSSYPLLYNPEGVWPHPKQEVFLSTTAREVFYGGAAGPGKSTALLLAALQYVDVPGYSALILRRTYSDLALPGALMDVSRQWLDGSNAQWHQGKHTWTFPSGASLTFGHLEREATKYRYRGAEFQFIGWDELTQFTETQYTFLFSRLRRTKGERRGLSTGGVALSQVPLRMRSASNPGDSGHEWVRDRFVDAELRHPGVVFIPARMHENPSLDTDEYLRALEELSPAERERLVEGDWDATDDGGVFNPDTWPVVHRFEGDQAIRWWDMAGSEPTAKYPDPDWTVGLKLQRNSRTGSCCVTDVVRFRKGPTETEAIVAATADHDGRIPVAIEEEPGSASKALLARYSRHVLHGKTGGVHGIRSTGDKELRARPVAAAGGRGEISVLRAPWNRAFFAEARRFPDVPHDDQVDALSGAYGYVGRLSGQARVSVPSARIPDTVRSA